MSSYLEPLFLFRTMLLSASTIMKKYKKILPLNIYNNNLHKLANTRINNWHLILFLFNTLYNTLGYHQSYSVQYVVKSLNFFFNSQTLKKKYLHSTITYYNLLKGFKSFDHAFRYKLALYAVPFLISFLPHQMDEIQHSRIIKLSHFTKCYDEL